MDSVVWFSKCALLQHKIPKKSLSVVYGRAEMIKRLKCKKMPNISRLQHLKCEDLLFLLDAQSSKLNILVFWTFGRTKKRH